MDDNWEFGGVFGGLEDGSNVPLRTVMTFPDLPNCQGPVPQEQISACAETSTGTQMKRSISRTKQINFTIEEDRVLVSCWLNVSLDPVAGAGQRKASFWKSIERNYNAQKAPRYPPRSLRSLEGRWADIKEQANKFESHYNNVLLDNRSGYNDMDKVAASITIYNSVEKKPMTTLHCWEILRNEAKWIDLQRTMQHKDTTRSTAPIDLTDADGTPEDGSESQTRPPKRPIGRDAAKAAKRAASSTTNSQSSAEYTSLLSELHLQKLEFWREAEGTVAAKIDKLVTVSEESMRIKQKRDEREQLREDECIMAIDLETCNPGQRALYTALQKEILARRTSNQSTGP